MKRLITLFASLTLVFCAMAQEREFMLIEKTDGTKIEINVKDIQRFFFEQRPIVISSEIGGSVAEAVDLGLSVKWAGWNMGATNMDEKGKKFYPGDVEGNMDKETARNLQLPWIYCGSEYDIATVNWGDEWRLPNAVDWKELFEKCTWEVVRDIDYADMVANPYFDFVVKVTGPNGNSIQFPCSINDERLDVGFETYYLYLTGYYEYMCGNNNINVSIGSEYNIMYSQWGDAPSVMDGTEWFYNQFESVLKQDPYDFSFYVRPVSGASTKEFFKLNCYLSLRNEVYVACGFRMEGHEAYSNIEERGICYSDSEEEPTMESGRSIVFDKVGDYNVFNNYTAADTLLGPLKEETQYYIRAYAKIDGEVFYSETETITTAKALPVFTDITEGDLVDLGLHVKWASCNLGAESPEAKGTAVTWEDQTRHDWGISVEQIYGTEHDYACRQLGGEWRMPTYTELCELRDSCEWILGHYNDVRGYKVVGKNGNSVFVPYEMYLLSGTCAESGNYTYMSVQQNLIAISVGANKACYIRPVQGTPHVVLSRFSAGYWRHDYRYEDYCNIRVSVRAYGLEMAKKERRMGVCYSATPDVVFSEENFVEIESPVSGQVHKVKINNLQPSTTYYYRGVAIIDGEVYYTEENEVSTSEIDKNWFSGEVAEAVDLGLSVKWSSWNFSANKPSDKGERYNLFASMQYQYSNYNPMTDHFSWQLNENPQLYNNITEADEDLVDYVWGNGWRIPTKEEWQELIDQCTWKETTVDNVKGYQVTGKNGNSIFLPFCGYSTGNKDEYIYSDNSCTHYWSATMYHYDDNPNSGSSEYYYFDMFQGNALQLRECWFGDFMWIRPVKE